MRSTNPTHPATCACATCRDDEALATRRLLRSERPTPTREGGVTPDRRCGALGVDGDGHCVRCGLEAPDPRETIEVECPPGFFDTPTDGPLGGGIAS